MDVLGAIIIALFAKIRGCKYQDNEKELAGRKEAFSNERAARSGTSRSNEQSGPHFSGPHRGKTDRTAWGSYTESAPPVLPANACIPGFEDELLLAIRRQHDEQGNEDPARGDSEGELWDSSDETDPYGGRKREGKGLGDGGNAPTHRSRDRLPFSFISSFTFFPTICHGNGPSSLFGSTSRPAATTLRRTRTEAISERTPSSRASTSRMAAKTHTWISLWFLLTAPVIFWDAAYCFMRPRSFKGGDLHWIWKPYEIYQEVDLVYGVEAYNRGEGFANAQSSLNVIETLLNLCYVYAQHVLASPTAPLIGFASAVMTLSKTVLYGAQEYFCGGCATGHNGPWSLFWFWILPNSLWLIVPSLIISRLSRDIADGLTTASKVNADKKD